MHRRRTVAGPPHRTASAAWDVVQELIADTLVSSDEITAADVAAAFVPLRGIGAALIAGGHLESAPIVLASGPLHVSISVVTGTPAMSLEENLDPIPGGRGARSDWVLYLPSPAPLAAVLAAATKNSAHLSVATPPAEVPEAEARTSSTGLVDLGALGKLRAST